MPPGDAAQPVPMNNDRPAMSGWRGESSVGRVSGSRTPGIVRGLYSGKLKKSPVSWRSDLVSLACRCLLATCLALVLGDALAMSREAQEYMDIQTKIAPDQCELKKLSAQAAAAQRDGDRGKRQELLSQMEPIAKRIQTVQPKLQELSKHVQPTSPDYAAVAQRMQDLSAKCK